MQSLSACLVQFRIMCWVLAWSCAAWSQSAGAQAPRIDKIDPPGWWVGLPEPMLLAHGENLNGAHIRVAGKGVLLAKTQVSENGHWAFLWLRTKGAAAQTVTVSARNSQGQSRQPFVLAARSTDTNAHRGFSPADVLYLIMTDRFARGAAANDRVALERDKARAWHGGNLAGIEQHLDYLQQLGVTAVWTTPVPVSIVT